MKYPLAVMATAALAASAFGVDRLVPQQYPTIQAAVDASVNGDRVVVSPGLYRESVRFAGKSIMLEGSAPDQVGTVIIDSFGAPGYAVDVSDSLNYVGVVGIRHLTVTSEGQSEYPLERGVSISYLGTSATVLVENCIFRDVRGTAMGALTLGHTNCIVRNCLFERNSSQQVGNAIYAWVNVGAVVENCVFKDHNTGPGIGTFYAQNGSTVLVRNSVVRNSPQLTTNWGSGVIRFEGNQGCAIGAVDTPGYIDGGGNNWNGPCPDCDGDGVIDLEEMLFNNGDCNANGLLDACEIPSHPNWDRNNDGILDACQCLADISGNGFVDGVDLAIVLGAWGSPAGGKSGADIDGDGIVNGSDLAYVLSGWGPCPN